MKDTCRQFRESWLEHALESDALRSLERESRHLADCTECAEWRAATRRQIETLSSLTRVRMPERLESTVANEVGQVTATIERAFGTLPRLSAPPELADRVSALIATPLSADDAAKSVQMLDVPSVPPVLERLVGEELADPQTHRVDRFVGNLDARRAPEVLEERTNRALRRSTFYRLVLLPLGTVAAAALVVWISLLGVLGEEPERERSFRVVRADTLDQLDPLARGLASALGGAVRESRSDDAPQERQR